MLENVYFYYCFPKDTFIFVIFCENSDSLTSFPITQKFEDQYYASESWLPGINFQFNFIILTHAAWPYCHSIHHHSYCSNGTTAITKILRYFLLFRVHRVFWSSLCHTAQTHWLCAHLLDKMTIIWWMKEGAGRDRQIESHKVLAVQTLIYEGGKMGKANRRPINVQTVDIQLLRSVQDTSSIRFQLNLRLLTRATKGAMFC